MLKMKRSIAIRIRLDKLGPLSFSLETAEKMHNFVVKA